MEQICASDKSYVTYRMAARTDFISVPYSRSIGPESSGQRSREQNLLPRHSYDEQVLRNIGLDDS